jgi:hypothetical protein
VDARRLPRARRHRPHTGLCLCRRSARPHSKPCALIVGRGPAPRRQHCPAAGAGQAGELIRLRTTSQLAASHPGGPEVKPPTRAGYGTELIRRVVERQLGGSVDTQFAPESGGAVVRCSGRALLKSYARRVAVPLRAGMFVSPASSFLRRYTGLYPRCSARIVSVSACINKYFCLLYLAASAGTVCPLSKRHGPAVQLSI